MNRPETSGLVVLIVGVLVLALVLAWQVRAIMGSPFPRLRAFETLTIGIPLLLIVFASAYYLIQNADANSFTAPLSKTDALYFTITVFSTVGLRRHHGQVRAGPDPGQHPDDVRPGGLRVGREVDLRGGRGRAQEADR